MWRGNFPPVPGLPPELRGGHKREEKSGDGMVTSEVAVSIQPLSWEEHPL